MKKRTIGTLFILCILAGALSADTKPFYLKASPAFNIPLGDDQTFYTVGGGVVVNAGYSLPFFQPLSVGADIEYHISPVKSYDEATGKIDSSLSFFSTGGLLGLTLQPVDRLLLNIYGKGGYFFTFFNDDTSTFEGHPYLAGGGGIHFLISESLSIGTDVFYRNYLGLYNDLSISIGTTVFLGTRKERAPRPPKAPRPEKVKPEPVGEEVDTKEQTGESGKSGLEIVDSNFVNIFPVFYTYYNSNPIGSIKLKNHEDHPLQEIRSSLFVQQYMDNPKEMPVIASLQPGEEIELDIYGLFTKQVLDITEGTMASASMQVSYLNEGVDEVIESIETLRFQNRNALTWDDDRKASAFVTAKDPAVMKFSKNIIGWIKNDQNKLVNKNLQIAMALHEALDLYGISYVIDPTTPYAELSAETMAVDFLQFPRQTLEYLAGDCDDLSILYASLLEAAGVQTAFVTVPGHIFLAFSLDLTPDQARKKFLHPDELIFMDGGAWVPVEITDRGNGFSSAWLTGAKQWRENEGAGQAGFFPMHEAWQMYEPVGFPGSASLDLPAKKEVIDAFSRAVAGFIEREMGPQLTSLRSKISSSQEDVRYINKLGVLYARYGMPDKAEEEFSKVLQKKEYLPALLNMGNLYFLREDMREAGKFYDRAFAVAPNNPKVLLAVARVNHERENYAIARDAYSRLKDIDSNLADRFSYLDLRGSEAARAAEASGVKREILWEEEL